MQAITQPKKQQQKTTSTHRATHHIKPCEANPTKAYAKTRLGRTRQRKREDEFVVALSSLLDANGDLLGLKTTAAPPPVDNSRRAQPSDARKSTHWIATPNDQRSSPPANQINERASAQLVVEILSKRTNEQ